MKYYFQYILQKKSLYLVSPNIKKYGTLLNKKNFLKIFKTYIKIIINNIHGYVQRVSNHLLKIQDLLKFS